MADWLTGSYMVLKIAVVVFCTLFLINGVSLLSSHKMGKIPLGDFIIIGLVMLLIFHSRAKLTSLAQSISDGISLVVSEVDAETSDIRHEILGIKSGVDEIFSVLRVVVNGEVADQMHMGIKYQIPQ